MQFSRITIGSAIKGVITMTPIRFYEITDHHIKYVVMYQLQFTNPKGIEINATIPYYVSDGTTNKLRANMLYPFMCYSRMSDADTCPYDLTRNSFVPILIKYRIIEDLNIDVLDAKMFTIFSEMFHDLPDEIKTLRIKLNNPFDKRDRGNDLISVLQRITNLLDFLICISCNTIRQFAFTDHERKAVEAGKYCPLSQSQIKAGNDHTDLSIPGEDDVYTYRDYRRIQITDNARSPFNAHFRLAILATLHSYYQLFVDSGLVGMTPYAEVEYVPVTIAEFNGIIDVCNKSVTKTNMKNYEQISIEVAGMITSAAAASVLSQENRKLLQSTLVTPMKPMGSRDMDADTFYNQLLKKYAFTCVSKNAQIGKKIIAEMSDEEIMQELTSYSDFIDSETIQVKVRTTDGTMQTAIMSLKNYINKETTDKTPEERIAIFRKFILDVRMRKMRYNYNGQLRINVPIPGKNNIYLQFDVDSTTETLSNLKSKIRDKLRDTLRDTLRDDPHINPSFQQELHLHTPTGTIIMDNDRKTIAEYKIPNESEFTLVFKQPPAANAGGKRRTHKKRQHKKRNHKTCCHRRRRRRN